MCSLSIGLPSKFLHKVYSYLFIKQKANKIANSIIYYTLRTQKICSQFVFI